MILESGSYIGRFRAKQVRDALNSLNESYISLRAASRWAGRDSAEMLQLCIDQGYVEATVREGKFFLTEMGRRLALAKFGRPIKREKADELLEQFLERVRETNADTCYPMLVTKVAVFGSYLNPEKEELGDIDLALEMDRRPGMEGVNPLDAAEAFAKAKNIELPRTNNIVEKVYALDNLLHRYLKARRKEYGMTSLNSMLMLGCPYRIVHDVDLATVEPWSLA